MLTTMVFTSTIGEVLDGGGEKMNVKEWRESLNLSGRAAARLVGVSQNAWRKWERGISRPSIPNMVRLFEISGGAINDWGAGGEVEAAVKALSNSPQATERLLSGINTENGGK